MTWIYKNKKIESEDDLPQEASKAIGYIYLITHLPTNRKYIGKKLLTSAGYKTVNGKKKKIRKTSDWMNYWSSSPKIKEYIKKHGTSEFTREILVFSEKKGALLYLEELALYLVGALEAPESEWWNDNIRAKVYRNWVKPNEAKELRHILNKLTNTS